MTAATGAGHAVGAGRPRLRYPPGRVLAAALVLVLSGCSGGGSSDPSSRPLSPPEFDEGVVHVHGLGVDPGDGRLYAATHTGLFVIGRDGAAQRVANRAQDTMGFTVVGPGRFLGSGHPDFREDPDLRPPLLGLIESTDSGQTWQRRSLRGTADFHVLHAAHDLVYGYDSTGQRLMVSADGRDWQTRSSRPLHDFEVSPADPDRLVASDTRALLLSRDGGRTFQPLPAPAAIAELAWAQDGTLYAASLTGRLYASTDEGRNWSLRSEELGVPEAMLAGPARNELYVAATGTGIRRSTDGGATFSTLYRTPAAP